MKIILSLLFIIVVAIFLLFILKRAADLIFREKTSNVPLHEDVADVAEDVASAAKVVTVLASFSAWMIAPTGLLAIASAIGFIPKPIIFVMLPALLIFTTISSVVSIAAKLYVKHKKKQHSSH